MGTKKTSPVFHDINSIFKGSYSDSRAFFLLTIAVVQFGLIINSSWRAVPDGALYLELGEALAQGRGYVFNGEPHTYVPPGYPALIAAVNLLMRPDFLIYRVAMALIGFLTGALGCLIVLRLAGKDAALFIGGVFWLSHVLLENSTFTCSDVFFALWVFVSIHAVIGLRIGGFARTAPLIFLSGLVAGLPALVRVNGWGIPPALAIYLISINSDLSKKARILAASFFMVVSFVPTLLWELHKMSFPQSANEGTYFTAVGGRDFSAQLSIMMQSLWDYFQEVSYALMGVSLKTGFLELFVPALVLIGVLSLLLKGERLLVPMAVIQFLGLSLSPAGSRYLIAVMPALYVCFVEGLICVLRFFHSRVFGRNDRQNLTRAIVLASMIGLGFLNLAGNAGTVVQARTPMEKNGPESARDLPFFLAGRWLKDHGHDCSVMTMHPRVIRYVSGLRTVELLRSGVPESEVWVRHQDEISRLVRVNKPRYLFVDGKNSLRERQVRQSLEDLGLRLQRIPNLDQLQRFSLWEIEYPS